ncbi:PilW family protein [Gynuella sunshinyii]|uniref:Tfp pilus assembly protein PilW n=1 Tax=Gynuella sunshinyii YC6258 TaxID=1445510 RepID=A0A0C5VSF9_9GAMM|nr:prepilin-type N-terminal cleavage/methylation domain-containing protein [Gynuella sunshinyii]AJQ97156.1 tfp pilus assembly protein PilW [Gynuella sunshinyii YC6258]
MKSSAFRAQSGFSLIELMVTLVVSLISILAMLTLYQSSGRNSAETKMGAFIDGQVQIGLLAADKLLQGAGYQPFDPSVSVATYGADLLLIKDASIQEDGTVSGTALSKVAMDSAGSAGLVGQALIWHANNDGTHVYKGIYAPSTGGLWQLTGQSMSWDSTSWRKGTSLIAVPAVTDGPFQNSGQVTIRLTAANCRPFGVNLGGLGGIYSVSLQAVGYAASNASQRSQTCLINFRIPD